MAGRISMLTTVSNDCPGGWNPACYDIHGTYTADAGTVYNLIQNQGWRGDEAWYAMAIVFLESSFVPDVIAYCPAGSCQPIEVHAIGLFQIYWEVHKNYDYEKLKTPAYNVAAAWDLYQASGWDPWPHSAETVRSLIPSMQAMVAAGGTGQLPPDSGFPGIPNQEPQISPPVDLPEAPQSPTIAPPAESNPYEYPNNPAEPSYNVSGFDAIYRLYTNDLVYYTGYDGYLVDLLVKLGGRE